MSTFKVLSIDAWGEGDSWTWNNWFTNESVFSGVLNEENALEFFWNEFSNGTLSFDEFKEKYEIDDDQYNLVLVRKDNQMPILAIEYGSEL